MSFYLARLNKNNLATSMLLCVCKNPSGFEPGDLGELFDETSKVKIFVNPHHKSKLQQHDPQFMYTARKIFYLRRLIAEPTSACVAIDQVRR
jgi:hypothetical protein